jgi:signal transduction histidine kinase
MVAPIMSSTADPLAPAPPPRGWATFWRSLTGPSIGIAVGLAIAAAAILNPIFRPPFLVLLGRTLFVAIVLLLAFTAARQWRVRWAPRWVVQVMAVVLAAPVATLLVYMLSVGGNPMRFFGTPPMMMGFLWIAGAGILLGTLLALGALVRERDAQANAQALQFALERETLQRQATDAQLAVLQSQIAPHFLFNTLANVQALVESGSPRAAPLLASLIAYLRAAMPRLNDRQATLGSEAALVAAYLELMQMRMPDRLHWSLDIPEGLRARRFPAMALLTLVENAVRHGVDPSETGGRIEVGARVDDERGGELRVWVRDTGAGMSPTAQAGTGLANLRARLQAAYGPGARLEMSEHAAPHGVHAEIVLPKDGNA